MRATLTFLLIVCMLQLSAQDDKTRAFGNISAALINGQSSVSGQAALSAGVYHQSWYLGLGSALDYYQYRSVPFYLTAAKDFHAGKLNPFASLEAGRNFAAVLDKQRRIYYDANAEYFSSFDGGWYSNAGIGLRFPGGHFPGFALSLGFSTKTMRENWQEQSYEPGSQTFISFPRSNSYTFNRLMIRAAFIF